MADKPRFQEERSIEQIELAGFSRSIAEIEWLLLALVLLHYQVAGAEDDPNRSYGLGALVVYLLFITGFRYWHVAREESRTKLMIEIVVMVGFVSFAVWWNGGPASPLLNLYVLVVIATAITLGKLATVAALALVAAAYIAMVYAGGAGTFDLAAYSGLLARLLPLFLIAYLTVLLATDLRTTKAMYKQLSEVDELTGLLNARAFNTHLAAELRRCTRNARPFSVLMFDCDGLKQVNDQFGHEAGNKLLQAIGSAASRSLRSSDALARYGGDEFVALLPDTDAPGAMLLAERIRDTVDGVRVDVRGESVEGTVSMGVASYPDDAVEARDLIDKADAALYRSKRKGRNRITSYSRSATGEAEQRA